MKEILGTELNATARRDALSRFVHRFTGNHKPTWANGIWKDGKPYPLQFKDDSDWLAHTTFTVDNKGNLSSTNHYCHSMPTWPNNPELRK